MYCKNIISYPVRWKCAYFALREHFIEKNIISLYRIVWFHQMHTLIYEATNIWKKIGFIMWTQLHARYM